MREQVNKGALQIVHCSTELQLAYIFTKALNVDRFIKLRSLMAWKKWKLELREDVSFSD
jgi:hypothetical protein